MTPAAMALATSASSSGSLGPDQAQVDDLRPRGQRVGQRLRQREGIAAARRCWRDGCQQAL